MSNKVIYLIIDGLAWQVARDSMGYLLAASGPPLIGLLRDSSGGWGLPLALCLALAILALNAADSPAFAIAGLVIPGVTLTVLSRTCCRVPRFWPREFFPLFYAVHLAVIGLMVM